MESKTETSEEPQTGAVAVLQGMYAAEARYLASGGPGEATFEILAPFFSPDVVLHQADALPYGGTWRGHEGMERFMVAMIKPGRPWTWSSRPICPRRTRSLC